MARVIDRGIALVLADQVVHLLTQDHLFSVSFWYHLPPLCLMCMHCGLSGLSNSLMEKKRFVIGFLLLLEWSGALNMSL